MAQSTNKSETRIHGWSFNSQNDLFNENTGEVTSTQQLNATDSRTLTDTFIGKQLPGWRQKIRAVQSATTAASGTRFEINIEIGHLRRAGWTSVPPVNKPGRFKYDARVTGVFTYQLDNAAQMALWSSNYDDQSDGLKTPAYNRAVEKLHDQLRSFETSVEAGEDVGEIRKTTRGLVNPMKDLRSLMTRTLSRTEHVLTSKAGVVETARSLCSTLLEYRFGIIPITHSVAGTIVGLQNRDNIFEYFPFGAKGQSQTTSRTTTTATIGYVTEVLIRKTVRTYCQVQFQGVWAADVSLPKRAVRSVVGLRLKDVVPTVYNILPYSWLIDYASSIGSIISSLNVPYAGVRWCNQTKRCQRYFETEVVGFAPTTHHMPIREFSPSTFRASKTSFARSNVTSMPVPKLEFRNPFGTQRHTENIIALLGTKLPVLRGLFKKRIKRQPDLPDAFQQEVGRRGLRVPYPFH